MSENMEQTLSGIDYGRYAQRLMEDRGLIQNPDDPEELWEASFEYADLLRLPERGQERLYEEMQDITVETPPMTEDSDPLENVSV